MKCTFDICIELRLQELIRNAVRKMRIQLWFLFEKVDLIRSYRLRVSEHVEISVHCWSTLQMEYEWIFLKIDWISIWKRRTLAQGKGGRNGERRTSTTTITRNSRGITLSKQFEVIQLFSYKRNVIHAHSIVQSRSSCSIPHGSRT